MTLGEKIQSLRKKETLSQEDLGQKLLVSRQTVSLWENGQTLPSIDNLIRLREIFGVSLDEMLCDDGADIPPNEHVKEDALETYSFEYTDKDISEMKGFFFADVLRAAVLFSLFWIIFFASLNELSFEAGMFLGALLLGTVICAGRFLSTLKYWKKAKKSLLTSVSFYEVYGNSFNFRRERNGETERLYRFSFDEIEKVQEAKGYMLVRAGGILHIIKKDRLPSNSLLMSYINRLCAKNEYAPKGTRDKTISVIFIVLSVTSELFAIAAAGFMATMGIPFIESMWIFFVFLPLPLASVAFGFYLRKKRIKWKANVIVGVIMSVMLCIYGSFSFAFYDVYDDSGAHVARTEELLGIDIPEYTTVNTMDFTGSSQSSSQRYSYYRSFVYFEDASVKVFEESLPTDERWLTSLPTVLIGLAEGAINNFDSNYYLLYNADTKEFNSVPKENGRYKFIMIRYSPDQNEMYIDEYETEYIK